MLQLRALEIACHKLRQSDDLLKTLQRIQFPLTISEKWKMLFLFQPIDVGVWKSRMVKQGK